MSEIRLVVDSPAAGVWNMAVDEMLLERAAEQGIATLRLYQWTPATLSLGYFQRAEERASHPASLACPIVRRSSGGGAIVHDRELTYSLSLPMQHPLAADAETLYRETHGLLVAVLAELGVAAALNERTLVPLGGDPFLCFQRRSVGDVLVGGFKVCGSAQRRSKGAILQHGSLLVEQSAAAPELPGLRELTPSPLPSLAAIADAWLAGWHAWLARRGVDAVAAGNDFNPAEVAQIQSFAAQKYDAESWTNRR
jgi:lipoate-protein ligase A